jgi:hypothetical protein
MELENGFFSEPCVVRHSLGDIRIATSLGEHPFLLVELITCADVEASRKNGNVLIVGMVVSEIVRDGQQK